ncbi:hypothetical protein E3P92_01457 [Wallemia ichthyophaga]|uniref:CsbD-like domain-containing protein n=1 Tax=Wallemia ichthyophaga TaxID=245174 RepID=A0A4T0HKI1_WALIC|nr:hypothetical protein E3P91_01148 [Wallemia ichthyophaga]TIA82586.1 hypothetical protein E3P98_01288 [Wallemia ichthyophaga]TIA92476.1 hypothetical protein E3P97_01454 [Wallemia ichthyophaga]TIA95028.1 hypothetical protein E3P96_03944 [Wallemia ichthyophaga]TIB01474.1 hypothetical protein E3P95_01290 [Wallemia ichthyophaga]
MSSEPSKMNANYDSTMGSVKEQAGNLLGNESLKHSGTQQHASGEAEKKAATAKQYGEGAVDNVAGKVQNIGGAVTGDKGQQAEGAARENKGDTKREFA